MTVFTVLLTVSGSNNLRGKISEHVQDTCQGNSVLTILNKRFINRVKINYQLI